MKNTAILFFILIGVTLFSCNKQSSDKIVIGEYASLTGNEATFGLSQDMGLKIAIEDINASGGLLGKKVELATEDNQGKTNETVSVVNKLINVNKVCAVIGEVASSRSKTAASICQNAKIPMITPASTNPEVTKLGDYIFRVCYTDSFQAVVNAKFALEDLKLKKVAILIDQKNAYSTGLAENFKNVFEKLGGTITTEQKYSNGDKDFKAQLTSIKATSPEAVFIPGYYTDVNLISIQARESGLTVPLFGGDGWESEKLVGGKAKDALEGCYFSTHVSAENPDANVKAFIDKYRAKYSKEPDCYAFLAYDAGMILFDAIKKAGSTDGTKIRDMLTQVKDFPGVSGKISINAQRNAVKPCVIIEIKDGKFKYKETINP